MGWRRSRRPSGPAETRSDGSVVAVVEQDVLQCVYGVVPARTADALHETGVDGRPVGAIRHGPVAALTSPVDSDRVRPSRSNLSAHERVVTSAHRVGPVIPVRFGTVMPDHSVVLSELLVPGRRRLEAMLQHLDGKDEFRVKCRYLEDVALREVVERSRTIQRLRQRLLSVPKAVSQGERIRLGELVAAELAMLRQRDAATLIESLAPHVLSWEQLDDPSEDVPLHAAVLVDRRNVAQLESALERIADAQRTRMHIELIGPLPAWDFCDALAGAA